MQKALGAIVAILLAMLAFGCAVPVQSGLPSTQPSATLESSTGVTTSVSQGTPESSVSEATTAVLEATPGQPPTPGPGQPATGGQNMTTPIVLSPDTPAPSLPSPTADLGLPTKTEPGKMIIALSQGSFATGQMIKAAVLNGLAQTIYTSDMKSDCSIVFLERLENQTWQPISGCISMRAPLLVQIGTGRAQMVEINPFSTHFGVNPGAATPALQAGTYRLKLTYRLTPEPEGEEPNVLYSAVFNIQP